MLLSSLFFRFVVDEDALQGGKKKTLLPLSSLRPPPPPPPPPPPLARPFENAGAMPAASSRRHRAAPSRVFAAALVLAAAGAAKVTGAVDPLSAAVASALPDPSPSLRSKGDTLYTTFRSNATTGPAAIFGGQGSANGTSAVKSEW